MKRLIRAVSDMPVVKLKGDCDSIHVGARRPLIARLCAVIGKSRHQGGDLAHGRRLFTKDEAIAVGALFFLAMREIGIQAVVASSDELAAGLHDRLLHEPTNVTRPPRTTSSRPPSSSRTAS